ncbi:MAG: DUF1588 domain-containing protein [Lentisphaerales bacterium]|nr:DUF1588 domain-containing protein [Lentisphaerales bacterium]
MKLLPFFTLYFVIVSLGAHEFIENYCSRCHDNNKQKGKVNLVDFEKNLDMVFDVYDQTILEIMPPEGKKQPSSQERQKFIQYLDKILQNKGHNRKVQPGLGNYVDHKKLFKKNSLQPSTEKRIWRLDPSAFAELANKIIGYPVYRDQRQGVSKENPAFNYLTPKHTFKDFSSVHMFEKTTTELLLAYAKDITEHLYSNRGRFSSRNVTLLKKQNSYDPLGNVYQTIYNRPISSAQRKSFSDLNERSQIVALIMQVETLFKYEVEMNDHELARSLGYALSEFGPDSQLHKELAHRPLSEVIKERLNRPEGEARIVRFMREYFEYDRAADVFKEEVDDYNYSPLVMIKDADIFCRDIIKKDKNVLRQLLTSNSYSVQGNFNSNHIKIAQRNRANKYKTQYHGFYNIAEEDVHKWRQYYTLQNRAGILTHPAWLISFSDNEHNQVIQRGRWISTKLLGGYVPNAPVEVDAQLSPDPKLTLREKLQKTRDSECWACHRHMDEQGLNFEQFDFFGKFRTQELGKPVEVHSKFAKDPLSYAHKLASSKKVHQVFLRHVFRFFMGRNETEYDANTLIKMEAAYHKNGGSLKSAIVSLLTSKSFTRRK